MDSPRRLAIIHHAAGIDQAQRPVGRGKGHRAVLVELDGIPCGVDLASETDRDPSPLGLGIGRHLDGRSEIMGPIAPWIRSVIGGTRKHHWFGAGEGQVTEVRHLLHGPGAVGDDDATDLGPRLKR